MLLTQPATAIQRKSHAGRSDSPSDILWKPVRIYIPSGRTKEQARLKRPARATLRSDYAKVSGLLLSALLTSRSELREERPNKHYGIERYPNCHDEIPGIAVEIYRLPNIVASVPRKQQHQNADTFQNSRNIIESVKAKNGPDD